VQDKTFYKYSILTVKLLSEPMQSLNCIFILLSLLLVVVYSYDRNRFFNMYMKKHDGNSDEIYRKFGSPRQNIFRLMPLHYQQQVLQTPSCLPHGWTCGPNLPPCCSGLMCYDGNAKRGRHCISRRK
jgi:hypothetical protein